MLNYPMIPAYIHDPTVFYDAQRGLCLVGIWGAATQDYWLFTALNGAWVSQRKLSDEEIQNLDKLRAKDIRR